jgi:tRNA threonylcarbamoyladenosine biosynthesis protein TsaE
MIANRDRLTVARGEDGALIMHCRDPEALRPLVDALAAVLAPGDALLLQGELGAGKTTLTQWLAHALGVDEDQYVASPSFALLHEYTGRLPVFHMDLYRLSDEEDVEAAGLLEYFEQQGVCVVEWPDRLGSLTPEERLDIRIEFGPLETRRFILAPRGKSWLHRVERIREHLAKATYL